MVDPAARDEFLMVAARLMDAIEAGDIDAIEALYGPDMTIWTTLDAERRDRASAIAVLAWVIRKMTDRRYEIVRREALSDGYLQQHVLHGVAPDGTAIANPACLVVKVVDGRITMIDEYLDGTALAPLLQRA